MFYFFFSFVASFNWTTHLCCSGFEMLGSGRTFDDNLYLVEKGKKRMDAGGRSF